MVGDCLGTPSGAASFFLLFSLQQQGLRDMAASQTKRFLANKAEDIVTVAILAQGTPWAVATSQAFFFVRVRRPFLWFGQPCFPVQN